MTLPASGAISVNDICAEFGLSNNTPFPAGFYGLGGAPASGPMGFADFYGRGRSPTFSLSANRTSMFLNGYNLGQTATITSNVPTTFSFSGTVARCSASQSDSTHAVVTLTTPSSGSGYVAGTVRVTATNGEYMDIAYSAEWGGL